MARFLKDIVQTHFFFSYQDEAEPKSKAKNPLSRFKKKARAERTKVAATLELKEWRFSSDR